VKALEDGLRFLSKALDRDSRVNSSDQLIGTRVAWPENYHAADRLGWHPHVDVIVWKGKCWRHHCGDLELHSADGHKLPEHIGVRAFSSGVAIADYDGSRAVIGKRSPLRSWRAEDVEEITRDQE
jgi:hypothetical protein